MKPLPQHHTQLDGRRATAALTVAAMICGIALGMVAFFAVDASWLAQHMLAWTEALQPAEDSSFHHLDHRAQHANQSLHNKSQHPATSSAPLVDTPALLAQSAQPDEQHQGLPLVLPPVDFSSLRGDPEQFSFISEPQTNDGHVSSGEASSAMSSLSGSVEEPARWNPCQPIGFRINPGGMPASEVKLVRQAMDIIGQATGLVLQDRGSTDVVWNSQQDNSMIDADAPLTFSFARAGTGAGRSDLLKGERVVGVAGPLWNSINGRKQIVAAHVVINSEVVLGLPSGNGAGSRLSAYLHELAHAVGLDHVNDQSQLMYPTLQPTVPATLGAGDSAGLRRVGADAGCISLPVN